MWSVSLTQGVLVLRYRFPLCSQTEPAQAFQASAELKIILSQQSAALRGRLASGAQTAVTEEASVITATMTLMLSSGNRLPEKESNSHSSVVPRLSRPQWCLPMDSDGWSDDNDRCEIGRILTELWHIFSVLFFIPGNHFLSSCRRVPASFHLSLNPSPFCCCPFHLLRCTSPRFVNVHAFHLIRPHFIGG